jgi:hypothetical protein
VLIGTIAPAAAGAVIDFTVTPLTLGKVLAGRSLLDDLGMTRQPELRRSATDPDDDPIADPLAPRRLRWAFFESPTRFRIEAVDKNMPGQARGQHPRPAGRALEAGRRFYGAGTGLVGGVELSAMTQPNFDRCGKWRWVGRFA